MPDTSTRAGRERPPPPNRRGGAHPRRPPGRVRPHLPADLPAGAPRERQLAEPDGRPRGDRERHPERRRADGLRSRLEVDRPAVGRSGRHVRHLQPRRLRAALDHGVRLRRGRVHARGCRIALARRRPACDLAALPPRPHLRGPRLVDPCPDADAPAVHRAPVAPRHAGAPPDEPRLDLPAHARRLGEPARERGPRCAARDAPGRVRARPHARPTRGSAASAYSSSRHSRCW